jgi:phosphoesterase RecJ-like protein
MRDAQAIFDAVQTAQSIVITSHRSPDGDSIGSSMGLFHVLKKWGKNVHVVHPDPAPGFLHWVPDSDQIIHFDGQTIEASELLENADLIFCLDYNEPSRVGTDMKSLLVETKALKVMIDHHLFPDPFCSLQISETSICSTSQLVIQWLEAINKLDALDEVSGTCLYLGIMTDTGSFRFPSVDAHTHDILSMLLRKGVKHWEIHEAVFDTNTIDRMRLRGFALSEKLVCLDGYPIAYVSLTNDELIRFNYQKGDTEGLVNQVLGIEGIKMAVLFVEKDGKIKISFRSKGEYVVNELARQHFEGGGHAYASGGVSDLTMAETIKKFVTNVANFIPRTV